MQKATNTTYELSSSLIMSSSVHWDPFNIQLHSLLSLFNDKRTKRNILWG